MKKVLLIHQNTIQHYRVAVYEYLYKYILARDYELTGRVRGNSGRVRRYFRFSPHDHEPAAGLTRRTCENTRPDAVILFINHRNKYLFPLILFLKIIKVKAITWSAFGVDSAAETFKVPVHSSTTLNTSYATESCSTQAISAARSWHRNAGRESIANNTLNLTRYDGGPVARTGSRTALGISTSRKIICVGRIEKPKTGRRPDCRIRHSQYAGCWSGPGRAL